MATRYRVRMRQGRGWLLGWLAAAVVGQLVVFEMVRRWFVHTVRGQLLDTAALTGNSIGWHRIESLVHSVLGALTVLAVLVSLIAVVVALARRQVLLAVVVILLILGANITTQVMKLGLERPDLGVDLARVTAGNSLPSGHATVAASVAVAVVLVLPARLRGMAAVAGAAATALAGVSTLSADWHRPSDVVAALLIVGIWAAVGGIVLVLAGRSQTPKPLPPRRAGLVFLTGMGALLLIAALVALALTDQAVTSDAELFDRRELFVAYAGGATGIISIACLVLAMVLATADRVFPDS